MKKTRRRVRFAKKLTRVYRVRKSYYKLGGGPPTPKKRKTRRKKKNARRRS